MKLCEFTIPIKTTNPLNSSQGMSRAGMFARAGRRKTQRGLTALVLSPVARKLVPLLPAGLVITLTRVAPSNGLDDDALPASCKSLRDGIADALGLPSDRDPHISWRYDQRRGAKGHYAVHILIEKRPANDVA